MPSSTIPYDRGRLAYLAGANLYLDNPHPPGTREAIAWTDGWIDASTYYG
jgi:hypothetical protein